jgi:hypothetical protein
LHLHAADPDACAPAVEELERHLRALTDYLGVEPPATPIDYYRFASSDELVATKACSNALSTACLHDTSVRSTSLLDRHELIHAYVHGSRPPAIVEEGLADVLSCAYGPWSRPRDLTSYDQVSQLSWQDLATWQPNGSDADLTYYRAGTQLVRYLVEQNGVPAVMAYYAVASVSSDAGAVNAAFLQAFGQSFGDAWREALALDLPGGPCLTPFECSNDPLLVGDTWQAEPACGVHYRYRRLDLSSDAALLFTLNGAADHVGERDSLDLLLACDGRQPFPTWTSYSPVPIATRLSSGSYALVMPASDTQAELGISATGPTPTCDAALAAPVPLTGPVLIVAAPADGGTWFTGIQTDSTQSLQLSPQAPSLQLCPDCTADSSCQQPGTAALAVDARTAVLQLATSVEPNGFTSVTVRAR